METWLVPTIALLALATYVACSLRWAWTQVGKRRGDSNSHSERAYRAFEFFFSVTVAIVGGIGFLRTQCFAPSPGLARESMVLLAWLEMVSMAFMVIAVTSHIGSKWERWSDDDATRQNIKKRWWRMVEPWMLLFAYGVATAVWVAAHQI